MEPGVRRFVDERGNEVRLTDERLSHILRRHPEMAFQMHRFADTLAMPDAVRPSRSSPTVQLYYRLYPDLLDRNRYVCLVVKESGRATPSSLPAISTGESKESEHGEQQSVGLVRP
jgi:hypothetical protein